MNQPNHAVLSQKSPRAQVFVFFKFEVNSDLDNGDNEGGRTVMNVKAIVVSCRDYYKITSHCVTRKFNFHLRLGQSSDLFL